jgi:hypothetical protein
LGCNWKFNCNCISPARASMSNFKYPINDLSRFFWIPWIQNFNVLLLTNSMWLHGSLKMLWLFVKYLVLYSLLLVDNQKYCYAVDYIDQRCKGLVLFAMVIYGLKSTFFNCSDKLVISSSLFSYLLHTFWLVQCFCCLLSGWAENSPCWFSIPYNKSNQTLFHTLHWVSQVHFTNYCVHWKLISRVFLSSLFLFNFSSSFSKANFNCRCLTAKGEESGECEKFAKYYRSLCPGEWVSSPSILYCCNWLKKLLSCMLLIYHNL